MGAALALIDLALFLYDIFKDNELQNWLQKSRFGEGDGFLSSHFKNAREEADELTKIFEEKKEEIIAQLNKEWLNKLLKEQELNQPLNAVHTPDSFFVITRRNLVIKTF